MRVEAVVEPVKEPPLVAFDAEQVDVGKNAAGIFPTDQNQFSFGHGGQRVLPSRGRLLPGDTVKFYNVTAGQVHLEQLVTRLFGGSSAAEDEGRLGSSGRSAEHGLLRREDGLLSDLPAGLEVDLGNDVVSLLQLGVTADDVEGLAGGYQGVTAPLKDVAVVCFAKTKRVQGFVERDYL